MALSSTSLDSLAGLWGSYDFFLIRDKHFTSASDMVDRFLDHYQGWWKRSPQSVHKEFAANPKEVKKLLTEWAEKKLASVDEAGSLDSLATNIMFKQLLYADDAINFGSIKTNWKKKVEIAAELKQYKPWSVAHAAASLGGRKKLRKHMEAILDADGSSRDREFFDAWWELSDDDDRPMLFPQVWGHTSGKLWLPVGESAVPARFSFGLINVASRSKLLIECLRKSVSTDEALKSVMTRKKNLAAQHGWLLFEFTNSQVKSELQECLDAIAPFVTY